MQNMVYYFSGTGNSYFAARAAADALGCGCTDIAKCPASGEKTQLDKAVIVFPSYAYGAPKPLLRFLKNLPFEAKYLALAVTCGSSPGGTLHSLRRVLKRRNAAVNYFTEIVSPENFIPIFGAPSGEYLEKRLASLEAGAKVLASAVAEGSTNSLRGVKPLSALVSGLFLLASPIVALFTRVHKKECTGCRVCAVNCPCGAIKINKKNKAVIKKTKCAICQRCLNICPQKCITAVRLTRKSGRYFHPGVSLKDLKGENKNGR